MLTVLIFVALGQAPAYDYSRDRRVPGDAPCGPFCAGGCYREDSLEAGPCTCGCQAEAGPKASRTRLASLELPPPAPANAVPIYASRGELEAIGRRVERLEADLIRLKTPPVVRSAPAAPRFVVTPPPIVVSSVMPAVTYAPAKVAAPPMLYGAFPTAGATFSASPAFSYGGTYSCGVNGAGCGGGYSVAPARGGLRWFGGFR